MISNMTEYSNTQYIIQYQTVKIQSEPSQQYSEEQSYEVSNTKKPNQARKKRISKNHGTVKGRSTDIISNVVVQIQKIMMEQGQIQLLFYIGEKPTIWAKQAYMILICWKYSLKAASLKKTQVIKQIKLVFKNMIKFRKRRIRMEERDQFHKQNLKILKKSKKICLSLLKLQNKNMPQFKQIKSKLKKLYKVYKRDQNPHGGRKTRGVNLQKCSEYILINLFKYKGQQQKKKMIEVKINETTCSYTVIKEPIIQQNQDNKYSEIESPREIESLMQKEQFLPQNYWFNPQKKELQLQREYQSEYPNESLWQKLIQPTYQTANQY